MGIMHGGVGHMGTRKYDQNDVTGHYAMNATAGDLPFTTNLQKPAGLDKNR